MITASSPQVAIPTKPSPRQSCMLEWTSHCSNRKSWRSPYMRSGRDYSADRHIRLMTAGIRSAHASLYASRTKPDGPRPTFGRGASTDTIRRRRGADLVPTATRHDTHGDIVGAECPHGGVDIRCHQVVRIQHNDQDGQYID